MKVVRPIVESTENTPRLVLHFPLRPALDDMLRRHDPKAARIARLKAKSCADQTSFALVDLDVELADGTCLQLLLKDLALSTVHETARLVKPGFLYNPMREIETYQSILALCDLGTPHFYGAVVRPVDNQYWLLLEKISGLRLCQVSGIAGWLEAARWLARLHSRFADKSQDLDQVAPLLRYDAAYYQLWLERATRFQSGRVPPEVWHSLIEVCNQAIERLIRMPCTLIHGEFYGSNILVEASSDRCRIRPIDWETAAVGPGLNDLAALTSGTWSERDQTEMAAAYHAAACAESEARLPFDDLLRALDDCRLHLAMRWLGWAADWSPPRENAHDWLGEAIALVKKMQTR